MKTNLLVTERDKSLRALQLIELEGLKELDRICRKYNISYSLGGGTCLGQLRHGGFIPWDDDIDIDMLTEDYQKFLSIAPKELDCDKFYLRSYKTDSKWTRSFSRLEIKYTKIGPKSWDNIKLNSGIFVDIFEWTYLPDNAKKRKKVTTKLFYTRWLEMYKMLHNFTLDFKYKPIAKLIDLLTTKKQVLNYEYRIINKNCSKKTDYIIDNAIINGNHGGYLAKGIDEVHDVSFENLRVMNKRFPDNFMSTIYCKEYMEWLPTYKRISHHKWYSIDFGPYKEIYNVSDNYRDLLTVAYSNIKLEQMKKVSMDMLDDLNVICNKYNINYYLLGEDAEIKFKEVDEYGRNWRNPLQIGMIKEEYDKFIKLSKKQIGYKYFLQTFETDGNYKYSYARLRLNFTSIRDKKINREIHEKFNNGFYIKIIPLIKTATDIKSIEKHMKKLRRINLFISIKWKKNYITNFLKGNAKFKIKYILLKFMSFNYLFNKLDRLSKKYSDTDSDYYVDASGYQFQEIIFSKKILGKGKYMNYLGHNVKFPDDSNLYLKNCSTNNEKILKLSFIKKEYNISYNRCLREEMENDYIKVSKKYGPCYLTYYDIPEYQLTVLRYDEKEDRLLSNDELVARFEKEQNEKEINL